MPELQQGKRKRKAETRVALTSNDTVDPPVDVVECQYKRMEGGQTSPRWFLNLSPTEFPRRRHTLVALVDTGSTKSYLGKEGDRIIQAWDPEELNESPVTVVVANGAECVTSKTYRVTVQIGSRSFSLIFHYLPSLSVPAIIGLDSIVVMKMCFDSEGTWWFRDAPNVPYRFEVETNLGVQAGNIVHLSPPFSGIQTLNDRERLMLDSLVENGIKLLEQSPGQTTRIVHRIEVGDAQPVKQRAYCYSPKVLASMYEELDRLLEEGLVEPSCSEWASPVVMVRKPDNSYRFCVDYRRLNAVSKKDTYPMPNMSQLLDGLRQARYLSKVDLKQAFLQVPLADEKSKDATSFIVPGRGLYRFTVMPFGLTGSPATFQRLADTVFGPELYPNVVVYLDDILICTSDFQTHCNMLSEVFRRLSEAGLRINIGKCEFGCSEVRYLGFRVNADGMSVDPDKTSSVTEFPVPSNVRSLRRFLGMAGWYRRFIQDFSTTVAPLTALLKKNSRWKWGEAQSEAFRALKISLSSAPVLARPNFRLPFTLSTDASQVGLGAVLTQIQDGHERVIAYSSRTLTRSEKNYSVTEKECLAVLWGITKHRHYLEGYRFTVVTDHSSLKWLLNLKDPSGRLARWALQLQQYDFQVEYRKGSQNMVADALSRIPEMLSSISDDQPTESDIWYKMKLEKVLARPADYPDWEIKNGQLYYHRFNNLNSEFENPEDSSVNWKLVVPYHMRARILQECHDRPQAGHLGIAKTHWRAAKLYYWPGMYRDILQYVRRCEICQQVKPNNEAPNGLMRPHFAESPWSCVSADIMGPYPRSNKGCVYLLVFLDVFTRWVELVPIRKATSEVIVDKFSSVILNRYGTPKVLVTDNGSNFVSTMMKKLANSCGIKLLNTPYYHSQANPVERSNRNIKQLIVSYLQGNHRAWDKYIGELQLALNSAYHESTKYSPAYLNFGRELEVGVTVRRSIEEKNADVEIPVNTDRDRWANRMVKLKELYHIVEENLAKASSTQAKRYNLRRRPVPFRPGDKVLKRTFYTSSAADGTASKLYPKYEGPFEVLKVSPSGVCRLRDGQGKEIGVWHSSKLKQYLSR